jgi:hypothetical protein
MVIINARVFYALVFYLLCVGLVLLTKPSCIFTKDGKVKSFGVGQQQTSVSLGVVVALMAVVCFYMFAILDIMFDQK